MTKPSQELCSQVLAKHDRAEKIRQAFAYADATVSAYTPSATFRRKGSRRSLFWEFAVDKLIELTADDPGGRIIQHFDTVSFVFDELVMVRLKKADMALYTSNYPTHQAELFHDAQADLFGYEGAQRVEAVYVPNRFDTGIDWTGIVARDRGSILWRSELVAPTAPSVVPMPTPVQPLAADLVKIKAHLKEQKKSDDGQG